MGPLGVFHRSLFVFVLGSRLAFLGWPLYAHQGSLTSSVVDGVDEEIYFATNSGLRVKGALDLVFGLLLRLLGQLLLDSAHTCSESISFGGSGSWPLSGGPMFSLQESLGFLGRRGEVGCSGLNILVGGGVPSRPGAPWGRRSGEQPATEAQ